MEESKQCVERAKLRHRILQVGAIRVGNPQELDSFIKSFRIETMLVLSHSSIMIPLFIDLGSNTTMMSYDTWVEIGQLELLPINFTIKSFNNISTKCLGTCYVKICIQDQDMYEPFYVADKHQ